MSALSHQLGSRVLDDHPADVGAAVPATLADLRPGESATISAVGAGAEPSAARRLFDLGFAPGSRVEVLRRAPMGDPVVVRVAGYDLALRRAQARCITLRDGA